MKLHQHVFLLVLLSFGSCIEKETEKIKSEEISKASILSSNSRFENEILSSSFVINDKERWQLLSSSQNYSCNYAVYAKFYFDESQKEDEVIITGADFMLLNYKNIIYLGLEDVFFEEKEGGLFVTLHVKAFGKYHGYPDDEFGVASNNADSYILPKRNLNFAVSNKESLRARRVLLPMHHILKSDFDKLDPSYRFEGEYLNSIIDGNRKLEKVYAKSNDRRVFDSEFFYKDGIYVKVKEDYDSLKDGDIQIMSPDTRCRDALFEIVIRN